MAKHINIEDRAGSLFWILASLHDVQTIYFLACDHTVYINNPAVVHYDQKLSALDAVAEFNLEYIQTHSGVLD